MDAISAPMLLRTKYSPELEERYNVVYQQAPNYDVSPTDGLDAIDAACKRALDLLKGQEKDMMI